MEQETAMSDGDNTKSVAVWFEIPTTDLDRAVGFYERIFAKTLKRETMGPMTMAVFPYERPGVSGAIIAGPQYQPAGNGKGPIVYVDAEGQLDAILARVEKAGGKVALPKTELPGVGSIAHVVDLEGNRIGLHAAP